MCFKLDSGADANVLPLDTYERLGSVASLMETNTVLTAFGNAKIRPEGEVKLRVVNSNTSEARVLDFYVTRASEIAILGCKACTEVDLVRRVSVDTVAENDVLTEAQMRAQYSDVFTGLGNYEKEYHIVVDSNVTPVIQQCRKVPYARYDKLKHTLVDLEKRWVIASVDRPTEWVHNLVITEKRDGRMRVCLDTKTLNVAIKRERYEVPTPADVQSRLSGMRVFTVTYMGHIVSADGMKPDPRKVEAIVNMPRPRDKQGLLRLLGMIKYLAQYIPNESNITAPLRSLLKQDVEWSWQPEHLFVCLFVYSGIYKKKYASHGRYAWQNKMWQYNINHNK